MNPRPALLAALMIGGVLPAQTSKPTQPASAPTVDKQKRLAELRRAKLSKPVFEEAAWIRDYDRARETAAFTDRLVLVYFTRSFAP